MNIKELEAQLMDEDLAIDGCAFRNKGSGERISFPSPKKARDFLIKFLTLETTAGVNYTDEEMINAYEQIKISLNKKNVISSEQLPYHREKRKPSKEVKYLLDGCHCSKQ